MNFAFAEPCALVLLHFVDGLQYQIQCRGRCERAKGHFDFRQERCLPKVPVSITIRLGIHSARIRAGRPLQLTCTLHYMYLLNAETRGLLTQGRYEEPDEPDKGDVIDTSPLYHDT